MASELPEGPLVTIQWLKEHLEDPDLIIADCRYNLFDHELGSREYTEAHIPGAYFLHMEKDLTGSVQEHGGRHPIPDKNNFRDSMRSIGLTSRKTVIAYDNDGSGASRLWWLLNFFGHYKVKVLDGGFPLWDKSGFPVTKDLPEKKPGSFDPVVNPGFLASVDDLGSLDKESTLVDSRARERYLGNVEPIDFKAGHIPGAISIPYTEAVKEKAIFRNENELKEMYRETGDTPVVYCGSGITSCVNFVAMSIIGKKPRLYAGGWSDWISYETNGVATGENP